MKAIITGGAGFIGSNLSKLLLEEGYTVEVVDDLSAGKRENVPTDVQLHEVDITSADLASVFAGADYVFHLAADPRVQNSIENPKETNVVNVDGTLAVLAAAKASNVKRVVFASSAATYGDLTEMPLHEDMKTYPISPYGLHKYVGEHYCRLWSFLYGQECVSLRYFNVYGPNFDPYGAYPLVVGYFLERLRQGKTLTITGDGSNTRDYVHVKDIARANLLAATQESVGRGEVINIGSGVETSTQEIADLIGGEIEYLAPRIEPKRVVADATRAKTLLGWQSEIDLAQGITDLKQEIVGA